MRRETETALTILNLIWVLLGDGPDGPDRGLLSLVAHGMQHTPRCPHGQWLAINGPRPHGDPCSDRCAYAHAAIDRAERWLKAHEQQAAEIPRQLELEAR